MKIRKTKNGQPYIILKSGKARFIKKKSKRMGFRGRVNKTKIRRVTNMARKSYKRRKSTGILGNLNRPLMGAAGVVLYESFFSPMIPLQGTAKDLLELVGGLYLSKKQGFLGATGKSLVILNSYQLLSGLVGTKLQGLIGNTSSTGLYNYA